MDPLRRLPLLAALVVGGPCLVKTTVAADSPAAAVSSVPLDADLGLENFSGHDSIAAALRRMEDGRRAAAEAPPLDLAVQGPCGRDAVAAPLAAEVRGHLDRFALAAGMLASPDALHDGPTRWTGRISLSNDRPAGREAFELRTTLGRRENGGILGVEAGPRIERRLGHGTSFFIDGKAQAQAQRASEAGWWSLRPLAPEAGSTVGVSANTGLGW